MLTIFVALLGMFSPIDLSGLFLTYCESTDVVLWGEILPSNVGVPRFSPSISSIVSLPIHIKGIIVGLILCTNCFTIQEVVLLLNVLMIKYRLNCTLRQTKPNQYLIYIREDSMNTLQTIVLPYMFPSMLYKIGL
jgi:hypothetical protein